MYYQCVLMKARGHQVAWIPAKFAKPGMTLKIRTADGWDDGWVVDSVGAGVPAERVHSPGWPSAWKKHRGRTDVPHGTFRDTDLSEDTSDV